MSNIKTIEVIKPLTGLEVGDVLTRSSNEYNFELDVETAGEVIGVPYTAQRFISLSESLINIDEFKAIEWFEDKEEIENEDYWKSRFAEITEAEIKLKTILGRIDEKLEEYKAKQAEQVDILEDKYISGERVEWADEALTVYHNMIDLLEKLKA